MRAHFAVFGCAGACVAFLVGTENLPAPGLARGVAGAALAVVLFADLIADRLLLRIHRARALAPREAPFVQAIVRELAARARLRPPRLYVIAEERSNVLSAGRSRGRAVIIVTEGLLDALDGRQLRAVLAHAIARIDDHILSATLAAGGAAILGRLGAFGVPFAEALIQLGISRDRALHADVAGIRLTGDPAALADALEQLERNNEDQIGHAAIEPAAAALCVISPWAPLEPEAGAAGFATQADTAIRVHRLRGLAERLRRTGRVDEIAAA